MLKDELKNIKSTREELRKFGLLVGSVLVVLGVLARAKSFGVPLVGMGGLLAFFGVMWPAALKPLQKIWMTLAILLGWVMSRVIIMLVFFVIVMPLALVARVVGKHFLALGFDRNAKSYWRVRETRMPVEESYERQF